MAAVAVAQSAGRFVVLGKKERGESSIRRVLTKKLIDGTQKALRLILGESGLAPQVSLKIGHQECRRNSLPRNVADDQAETLAAKVEKIVVVTANLACLMTNPGVFQRRDRRELLRKKTRLHLFRDLKLLRGAAFGFELFGDGAALRLDGVGDCVEADEQEGVAIEIPETGEDASPNR